MRRGSAESLGFRVRLDFVACRREPRVACSCLFPRRVATSFGCMSVYREWNRPQGTSPIPEEVHMPRKHARVRVERNLYRASNAFYACATPPGGRQAVWRPLGEVGIMEARRMLDEFV